MGTGKQAPYPIPSWQGLMRCKGRPNVRAASSQHLHEATGMFSGRSLRQAVGLLYTTAQRSSLLLYLNVKIVPSSQLGCDRVMVALWRRHG